MMNYFKNKEERAKQAIRHTEEMKKYPISKGWVYGEYGNDLCTNSPYSGIPANYDYTLPWNRTIHSVVQEGVGDAIYNVHKSNPDNIWVLNFASYKNPGGMFIKGSSAQEESLCHISNLYNHLMEEKHYYTINNRTVNNSLYMHRAIIHRNVTFIINDEEISVNVITCAAPNTKAAQRYHGIRKEECYRVFEERIKFLKYICISANQDINTLILGAWGCGVFGNDAEFVAHCFKNHFDALPSYSGKERYIPIIHPIPDDENFKRFERILDITGGV